MTDPQFCLLISNLFLVVGMRNDRWFLLAASIVWWLLALLDRLELIELFQ